MRLLCGLSSTVDILCDMKTIILPPFYRTDTAEREGRVSDCRDTTRKHSLDSPTSNVEGLLCCSALLLLFAIDPHGSGGYTNRQSKEWIRDSGDNVSLRSHCWLF